MEHFQRNDNLTHSPNNIFMRYTYTQIAEGGGGGGFCLVHFTPELMTQYTKWLLNNKTPYYLFNNYSILRPLSNVSI